MTSSCPDSHSPAGMKKMPTTPAPRSHATQLRIRLEQLGTRRGDWIEAGKELEEDTAKALREVKATPEISMGQAADLIGVSRQALYRTLGEHS